MACCIYCGNDADSEEHHLPEALGSFKDYLVLKHRLCSKCNGDCGKLDEQLCRSGIEAYFRKQLEIEGRKKHKEKINPFYRGSAGGHRLEMTGLNPKTGQADPLELIAGNQVRELRCVSLTAEDDTVHVITIPDGMKPEDFKKQFDSLGIKKFKLGDISVGEDEIAWVESVIGSTLKYERKTDWSISTLGPIVYPFSKIKFTVNARYFRCIAKIGFHYFLTKMPQFRGDESCFSEIRNFIINEGELGDCNRFISYAQSPLNDVKRLKYWGHVLSAELDYMQLKARVHLFAGPGSRTKTYSVTLGRNPSLIDYNECQGNFFAYYPKEERIEFDGEVADVLWA